MSSIIKAWVVLIALILAPANAAEPAGAALSEQDQACLACHGQEGLKKTIGKGEFLSLHVKGKDFAASVHGAIGCAGCHTGVDLAKHPVEREIASLRDYSIQSSNVCRGCHEEKFKLYEGSIHATMLRMGNKAAPVCSDCHSPHLIQSISIQGAITGVPCKRCHEPIFNAYAGSMHGKARAKELAAPLCSDCHRAHDVIAAGAGTGLRDACLGCHAQAGELHRAWLPNTGRHFEAVACAACHAPDAQRRVELRLHDVATGRRIGQQNGAAEFGRRAQAAALGGRLDAESLWLLLREVNQGGTEGKASLRGRVEAASGVEAHRLADKTRAVRDCANCHRDGAFGAVTVSVLGADGRPVRFDVHKEVLSSATSVETVRAFYAIGATRVKILDAVIALALLAGVAVPIGHLAMRWFITRRLRKTGSGPSGRHAEH